MFYLLAFVFAAGCNNPIPPSSGSEVIFELIDVGQGLSQAVVQNNIAFLFDMGPMEAELKWKETYRLLGKPQIEAIIISHRDLDHSGGLGFLDASVSWSGRLFTHRWEDTAFLRSLCSRWHGSIIIGTIVEDSVLRLSGDCTAECLWPPAEIDNEVPVPDERTNFYSVVCRISHGNNSVMVTGDIDSVVQHLLYQKYNIRLRSNIVVVPHHGSTSSVYPLFFGYLRPDVALISCGKDNSYGHPSQQLLDVLARSGILYYYTSTEGSICYISNGYYWESCGAQTE